MTTPGRSAALARALAGATDDLPEEFASRVAALAETRGSAPLANRNDVALLGAFLAMIGVCVAGWFAFGSREPAGMEMNWMDPLLGAILSQPWLIAGAAGLAIVQVLTFRRRTTI